MSLETPSVSFSTLKLISRAKWNIEQFHVTKQLGFVDWVNYLDRLHFDEDAVIDQHVEFQGVFTLEFLIPNDYFLLIADRVAAEFEFFGQAPFIDGFEQTGPFIFVYFDRPR
jgi:hypothetical protein